MPDVINLSLEITAEATVTHADGTTDEEQS